MDKDDVRPRDEDLYYVLSQVPSEALAVIKNKERSFADLKANNLKSDKIPSKPFKSTKIGNWEKKSYE